MLWSMIICFGQKESWAFTFLFHFGAKKVYLSMWSRHLIWGVEIDAISVIIFFPDILDDLFPKKLRLGDPPKPKGKQSLLTMKIQTSPKPKENPFTDFSPYDAYDRPPSESMNVRVLLTALQEFQEPEDSTDSGKTIHKSKIF